MSEIYEYKINKRIKNIVNLCEIRDDTGWDGIRIELDDESLLEFKIDNDQRCCETFGYYVNDKFYLSKYIESTINKINVEIDPSHEDNDNYGDDSNPINLTITIYTDNEYFKIILYNQHNGFYKHQVSVQILDECKIYEI
jgi:hypothetical protein